jgi:hypothetical protein
LKNGQRQINAAKFYRQIFRMGSARSSFQRDLGEEGGGSKTNKCCGELYTELKNAQRTQQFPERPIGGGVRDK